MDKITLFCHYFSFFFQHFLITLVLWPPEVYTSITGLGSSFLNPPSTSSARGWNTEVSHFMLYKNRTHLYKWCVHEWTTSCKKGLYVYEQQMLRPGCAVSQSFLPREVTDANVPLTEQWSAFPVRYGEQLQPQNYANMHPDVGFCHSHTLRILLTWCSSLIN